jgi:hypothetical protein
MMTVTVRDVWDALSIPEKEDACLAFWESTDSGVKESHAEVLKALAAAMRFREITLKRMPSRERARYLRRHVDGPGMRHLSAEILRGWIVKSMTPMMVAFVDVQGLPHTDGILGDDVASPDARVTKQGVRAIRYQFPPREVAIYLGFLLATGSDFWKALPEALEEEFSDIREVLAGSEPARG